jgi:hypothetical protein
MSAVRDQKVPPSPKATARQAEDRSQRFAALPTRRALQLGEANPSFGGSEVRLRNSLTFPFPRSLQQFAQTARRRIAVEFTRGHLENELFPLVRRQFRVREQSVALQKDQACRQRSSFVSVDKGMVAAKIKQIGRGDLDRIGHQRLTHHRRLGRRHGGLQQCFIANAACSAVRRQDFCVNRLDRRNCQVTNCFTQDKRLKSAEFFLISRLAAATAFFGSMVGRSGVKTIEPPSCTVTVT